MHTPFPVPYELAERIREQLVRASAMFGVNPLDVLNPRRRSWDGARARATVIIWIRDSVLVYGSPPVYDVRENVPVDDLPNWESLSWYKIAFLVNLDRTGVMKSYRVQKARLEAAA